MATFQRTLVTFRSQLLFPYIRRFSWSPGILNGEAPLRGPTTCLWYTTFDNKGTPFVYPLLKNGTPFTYPVYSFTFLLTAVNALSLKYEQITKPERFLDLFTTTECIFQLYWVFLQTAMTDFPILSYTLISEIPTLSCTWSLKKIPFSGGAPLKGHYRDYPSPVFVMVFGVHRFAGSVCNGVTNRTS